MIIHCPRCGFAQPEDQYCAQCGVNMQTFKKKEKSFSKKFSESLILQALLLVVVAALFGSYMIHSGSTPQWAQKLTKFQAASKSTKPITTPAAGTAALNSTATAEKNSADQNENLSDLTNKEIAIDTSAANQALSALPQASPAKVAADSDKATALKTADSKESNLDPSAASFRLIYAEISAEVLAKWVAESSRLGQFQNLQDYSAGILLNYKKRGDSVMQYLKTVDKKVSAGQTETNVSGTVSEDSSQMIGLTVSYEVKSIEANLIHGSVVVSRVSHQSRENFPAEFDLPKGAVFFMIDTVNRQNFSAEKVNLTMAPFQILNSIDFNAQKSKFVIILEPDLK